MRSHHTEPGLHLNREKRKSLSDPLKLVWNESLKLSRTWTTPADKSKDITDRSQKRLIRGVGMENHHLDHCCCCCGGRGGGLEVGYHGDHALIPRRREARLLRIAQLLVAGLLLLTAGYLALLFTMRFQDRCALKADQQVSKELDSKLADDGGKPEMSKLQGGGERPSAMLTAPRTRIYQGKRLNWESKLGVVCRGGFNCSDWELVVPVNGVYRVFLQITWRLEEKCPAAELCLSSDVIAFRDSYQSNRVALSMVDLVECRTPWKKSLYASRFVKLDAKSRLHVNSSFPELIAKGEHEVFFGAELIDSSFQ